MVTLFSEDFGFCVMLFLSDYSQTNSILAFDLPQAEVLFRSGRSA